MVPDAVSPPSGGSSVSLEIEVKIPIHDIQATIDKIIAIGGRLWRKEFFEQNRVYDFPDLRLMETGILIRLRWVSSHCLLTVKQRATDHERNRGYKVKEEAESGVEDGAVLQRLFFALGMGVVFRYEKYRRVFLWNDLRFMVDRTPIGNFLELEGDGDSIDRAAGLLGYSPADYITESYYSLFINGGGEGDMVFTP